jgi:hypothetical protein
MLSRSLSVRAAALEGAGRAWRCLTFVRARTRMSFDSASRSSAISFGVPRADFDAG